jgi:hypothetical protein
MVEPAYSEDEFHQEQQHHDSQPYQPDPDHKSEEFWRSDNKRNAAIYRE